MYRIDQLLKLRQKTFHTQDLAVVWGITNKNTLYTTIKRYVARGVFIPIQKGYYSTVSLANLDPAVLGVGFIHRFTYISCESVLFNTGIIDQPPQAVTLVSSISKSFTICGKHYLSRKLSNKFLNSAAGIIQKDATFYATPERAVADMLYFNPKYHFDNHALIDRQIVKEIQKEVGYL